MIIPQTARGMRLDRHLTKTHPEHSRAYWQKAITAGRVLLNGKKVTPHRALRGGEVLSIAEEPVVKKASAAPPPLTIIAETNDYLVIDKPAGLLVHPATKYTEPTLVDALLRHDPVIKTIGENPNRPGIVHRLDRGASGVMVIAKTQAMFEHLKAQWRTRAVHKEYYALVHGKLSKPIGSISFSIARSRRGGRMAARPSSQDGRAAQTNFEALKEFPTATLVKVTPETGRTHQIRAHFHALGHPLVGDPLYRTKMQRKKDRETKKSSGGTPRLMLHATKLTFTDLHGNPQTFSSPLPPEFNNLRTTHYVLHTRV